jgi:glycosyltransferase involved in cell wall biosynthesis
MLGERSDVPALLAAADLFVMSSHSEGLPLVLLEAMSAGVPVVATRVGGIPYLVDDGRTGFLVGVGDVDALTARLSELLGDDAKRRAFGEAARARAAERFKPAAVAARVRDVYIEASRGRGR